jgi:hypothetical protein
MASAATENSFFMILDPPFPISPCHFRAPLAEEQTAGQKCK